MQSLKTQTQDLVKSEENSILFNQNAKKTLLIKFGGNAMLNLQIQDNVIENICTLKNEGYSVILVHGGGPEISNTLDMADIETEFIGGHRQTDKEAMKYVEMALKGKVNGELVRVINSKGQKAVGLSGKDGATVYAKKRHHIDRETGNIIDLGQVGDVSLINPALPELLLTNGYIPVFAPIATAEDGSDYNINADMFAANVASALNATDYIVLTDVDGLMLDINNPDSLIREISIDEIKKQMGSVIVGGMIPKIESCLIALNGGVEKARIINGTETDILIKIFKNNEQKGTIIKK
jgi:acetylglutamate kinase